MQSVPLENTMFINEAGELIEKIMSVMAQSYEVSYFGIVNGTVDAINNDVWFTFTQDYTITTARDVDV